MSESYEIYESLRDQKGEKNRGIAKAIGISPATFTAWKKGEYTPKRSTMQKIADYFGVPIEYLMTGKIKNDSWKDTEANEVVDFMLKNKDGKETIIELMKASNKHLRIIHEMLKELNKGGDK